METRQRVRGVMVNGAAIRRHRMYVRNLSGAAFAREAGISPQYVSRIELGHERRVGPEVFGRIREVLRIDDPSVILAEPELAASHK